MRELQDKVTVNSKFTFPRIVWNQIVEEVEEAECKEAAEAGQGL